MKKKITKLFFIFVFVFLIFELFIIIYGVSTNIEVCSTDNSTYTLLSENIAVSGEISPQDGNYYVFFNIISKNVIPFAQDDYSVYFGSELFIDSFTKTQFYNLPIDYSNLFSTSPDSAYFGKIAWTNTNTVFTKTIITQLVFIYKGDQSTFPENIPITLIINEQYYSINLKCCTQSNHVTINSINPK